jgi:hypothetical protein
MPLRWSLWSRLKLALRKRPVVYRPLPYESAEFARLLSSRDPDALKQLAAGLSRQTGARPSKLRA